MYKHSCVIDASGTYKEFVLVIIDDDQQEHIQNYSLMDGDSLVDEVPPYIKPYANANGFVKPKWDADTSTWIESATEEEISAWEDEHPSPDFISLEYAKAARIQQSKDELSAYLDTHPIIWVDGQKYSVTEEKQNLLTSNIALYQLSVQAGNPRELKWNTTGDVCSVWTIENLSALALAIGDYVQPYVTYQQMVEVQINSCTTMEELESIVIDYSTVSTVEPGVLIGEQGS